MKKKLRKLSLRRETVGVLDLGRTTGAAPAPTEDTGPGTCCCVTLASEIDGTLCCLPPPGGTGVGGGGTRGGVGGGNDEVVY